MKKLVWIAAGIILAIALACGINLWQNAQVIRWQTDHMPELQHILTFAENKGADWATDELMISGVDGFRKKSLYKNGEIQPRARRLQRKIFGSCRINSSLSLIMTNMNELRA